MVYGHEPNISHLRIFECAVYVSIALPQRTKMKPQRRLEIYIGYESPSIIKYLEPLTGDSFTAQENKQLEKEIIWRELSLAHYDPRTKQSELEVQKIIHLQNLANQLPDAFTDPKKVTKSYIPVANAPIRIHVPEGQPTTANEPKMQVKCGRSVGPKIKILEKEKK
ncbi:uncharacterized protein LOC124911138 [Impatiens glandulifera]|uniref:uncharacterized protein LOC124911138 n=1 Tax=Impatiens glandulifera TaxID=253017 RepID=UPI001FB13A8D|nr:uncharacterized protein LOC124911138 [Impatiens glandulifera]